MRAQEPQDFRDSEPFYWEVVIFPIWKCSWISILKVGALPTKMNFALLSFGVHVDLTKYSSSSDRVLKGKGNIHFGSPTNLLIDSNTKFNP